MSGGTIKGGNVQIGNDGTAANNFTIYQPAVADGTSRWAVGVAGATTKDMVTVSGTNITLGGNLIQAATAAPAFSVTKSASQALSATTTTKVTFDTETFDTNNNFASSTFTPTVAGYYQININLNFGTTGSAQANLFKNGTLFANSAPYTYNASIGGCVSLSCMAYMNGTTDYLEAYVYSTAGVNIGSGAQNTTMSGFLARSA